MEKFKCSMIGCTNMIVRSEKNKVAFGYLCRECRNNHNVNVRYVELKHGKSVKELLKDAASQSNNADEMAKLIGVSFVTVYNWINTFFKNRDGSPMSFQEFKQKHICKSSCKTFNVVNSPYQRDDYLVRKIRVKGGCACMTKGLIRSCMPVADLRKVFKKAIEIEKTSGNNFVMIGKK